MPLDHAGAYVHHSNMKMTTLYITSDRQKSVFLSLSDAFFDAQSAPKWYGGRGSAPGPASKLTTLPRPIVGWGWDTPPWGGDTPPHIPPPLGAFGASILAPSAPRPSALGELRPVYLRLLATLYGGFTLAVCRAGLTIRNSTYAELVTNFVGSQCAGHLHLIRGICRLVILLFGLNLFLYRLSEGPLEGQVKSVGRSVTELFLELRWYKTTESNSK